MNKKERGSCIDAIFIGILVVVTAIGLAILFIHNEPGFGFVIRGIAFGGLVGYILAWFRFKNRG